MIDERCGKCLNCKKLEDVRRSVLACVNPPFSHADDGVVQVWNDSLERYPCLIKEVEKTAHDAFMHHDCGDIEKSMARTFFVCAWADAEEEEGRCYSGMELMDVAPETPEDALHHAMRFSGALAQANSSNIPALFQAAIMADVLEDKDVGGDEYADLFGHYMAMEALGHGVSWWDSHAKFDIKVPDFDGYDVLYGEYTIDGFGKIVSTKDIQSGQ